MNKDSGQQQSEREAVAFHSLKALRYHAQSGYEGASMRSTLAKKTLQHAPLAVPQGKRSLLRCSPAYLTKVQGAATGLCFQSHQGPRHRAMALLAGLPGYKALLASCSARMFSM